MTKYGSLGGYLVVHGIALPGTHPGPPHPGYTPPLPPPSLHLPATPAVRTDAKQQAVGLRSVAQLTLSASFSGFLGITEVYNLADVGNPDDHNVILGTD